MKAIVSEIYSAPRVTALARRRRKYGIEPGVALDLTSSDDQGRPWDFNDPEQRQRAEQLLAEQQPEFLIGSPTCTAFSWLQRIGASIPKGEPGWRDPEKMAEGAPAQWCIFASVANSTCNKWLVEFFLCTSTRVRPIHGMKNACRKSGAR